jgi:flagellar biogenesis protein FliO
VLVQIAEIVLITLAVLAFVLPAAFALDRLWQRWNQR